MRAVPFGPELSDDWDALCGRSYMATFLHTRRFLSYHQDRFVDRSLLFEDGGKWVGLLPAASDTEDVRKVISHPGATYGGIIHAGALRGERMVEALGLAAGHYAASGCRQLVYKPIPNIYHQSPAQDDLYALSRVGAIRCRCDLSSVIDLRHVLPISQRRRRGLKKARSARVDVIEDTKYLQDYWAILTENLRRKHDVTPVHSLEEIVRLTELFPEEITLVVGVMAGRVEGGVVLFSTPVVTHAQYIAASPAGHECGLLDAVFDFCIEKSRRQGKRFFDFGNSNEQQGRVINVGLFQFKSEFGSGGTVHEYYEINLEGRGW